LTTFALSIVYQVLSAGDVPTNMHFSLRSYLLMLVTELRDMLLCRAIWHLPLWVNGFSFLASATSCRLLVVAVQENISSTVNLIVAQGSYITSEICRRYQRTFIHHFNNLYIAKVW